ncbi:TetR/AcrR family transcriptional regulator [Allomuricauda sp. F6463D]|uniref:TetR/AcrR family transcriptional regulator n=1 Tax=Allomuricauda sp. F6463D TaxID=2926409 RepID=UPI001FF3BF8A|nr:TetR/AcrR family transcriptional regulator [Muricauda sp. F6463D]MCK0159611.1 TetR/AcrR family transcriptional regulator [Muricauda sp. F6463D]
MSRTKTYNEQEVIEKAMNLFWVNGFKSTSMQMLEKEMGINKFSIYSSFGNKNGVFLESLKCYKQKLNLLINKLENATDGIDGIKQYFYDFIDFSKENDFGKGCLITNSANEIGTCGDQKIISALENFTAHVRAVFAEALRKNSQKNESLVEQQADYLIVSIFGLSSATRVFTRTQVNNYIENIFLRL